MSRFIANLILIVMAAPLSAAITNVRVTDTTPTQAVLRFVSPACSTGSVEVSESSGFSPLVTDVDPAKFTNADKVNRDSANLARGQECVFVIGKQAASLDLTGRYTSRALQNSTLHFGRITVGAATATFQFRTAPLAAGKSFYEPAPVDPANPSHIAWPELSWAQNADNDGVIDPQTGAYIQRLSRRGAEPVGGLGPTVLPSHAYVGAAGDCSTTAGWTTPCALVTGSGSASYSGTSNPQQQLQVVTDFYPNSAFNADRIKFSTTGSMGGGATGEDLKAQVCVTVNQQTCHGLWVDITLPSTSGQVTAQWDFMSGVSTDGHTNLYSTNQQPPTLYWTFFSNGRAETSGSTVNIRFGSFYPLVETVVPGSKLVVNAQEYNVTTAVSGIQFTVSPSPGTLSNVPFSYSHFGFIIRKKTASSHTMTLTAANIQLSSYNNNRISLGAGFTQICGKDPQPQGWTIAGATNTNPITITTGQDHGYSTGNRVHIQDVNGNTAANGDWSITVTGARTFTIAAAGNGAYTGYTGINCGFWCNVSGLVYRPTDPKGYLCDIVTEAPGDKQTYWINPANGHREYTGVHGWLPFGGYQPSIPSSAVIDPALYPAAGGEYTGVFENSSGRTQILSKKYRGNINWGMNRDVGDCTGQGGGTCNSTIDYSYTTYVPDVGAQLLSFDPSWGCPGLYPGILSSVEDKLFMPVLLGNTQNSLACLSYFDVTSKTFVASGNTWRPPGGRFAGSHTYYYLEGYDRAIAETNAVVGNQGGETGKGPFGLPYSGAISPTVTACPSNPLGLTGTHCTTVTVAAGNVLSQGAPLNFDTGVGFQVGDHVQIWDTVAGLSEQCSSIPPYWDAGCPVVAVNGTALTIYRSNPISHPASGYLMETPTGYSATPIPQNNSSAWLVWDWKADPHQINAACPYGGQGPECTVTSLTHAPQTSHGAGQGDITKGRYILINDAGCDALDVYISSNCLGYGISEGATGSLLFNTPVSYSVRDTPPFSGVLGIDNGDFLERHPNENTLHDRSPSIADHFGDFRPNLVNPEYHTTGALAPGATQVYKLTNFVQTHPYDPKRNIVFSFAGHHPLLQVAGAGVTLTDDSADNWKSCLVYKAGECWAGSAPGEIYMNCPQCNPWPNGAVTHLGDLSGQYKCQAAFSLTSELRMPCAMTWPSVGNRYVQYPLYQRYDDGRSNRIHTSFLTWPGTDVGGSARELPDSSWAISEVKTNGIRTEILMAKLGAMPMPDGVNRMEFIPTAIPVPALSGATRAYVRFGYDPNFNCNPLQRVETCVAISTNSTIAATHPFMYETTDLALGNYSVGAPCASGCTIQAPLISQKVAWYQVVWTNEANQIRQTGPVSVLAAP
jgi:hypothetical protein